MSGQKSGEGGGVLGGVRQQWDDTDPKVRGLLMVLVGCFAAFLVWRAFTAPAPAPTTRQRTAADAGQPAVNGAEARDGFHAPVLPETPRNQGLEDLKQAVETLNGRLARLEGGRGDAGAMGPTAGTSRLVAPPVPASAPSLTPGASGAGASTPQATQPALPITPGAARKPGASGRPPGGAEREPGLDLNSALPGPVDTGALAEPAAGGLRLPSATRSGDSRSGEATRASVRSELQVWPEDTVPVATTPAATRAPMLVIPVNSALEAVMLSGFNARPSGSIVAAVGSVNSANSVGAPFVTRIKGQAILPNGWRLTDLGDCFLGGAGTAVLSTERAYVIADTLSCIGGNGEVWEGPVKAYGLDVDGTLGLAGKVVSKQGSLLLQAALTGMASGLGSALSPSALPSFNSNATGGQTAAQSPNLRLVGESAVGQGINQATGQLSKFYLDYAKEVFPVVEVTSGTRVTWVLTASVELKRRSSSSSQSNQKAVSP